MKQSDTIKDLATVVNEIYHLQKLHEDNLARIKVLEAYKAKTEKYGFFIMGVVALGAVLASESEKLIAKIRMLIP